MLLTISEHNPFYEWFYFWLRNKSNKVLLPRQGRCWFSEANNYHISKENVQIQFVSRYLQGHQVLDLTLGHKTTTTISEHNPFYGWFYFWLRNKSNEVLLLRQGRCWFSEANNYLTSSGNVQVQFVSRYLQGHQVLDLTLGQ
jgi:hypothetical protein